MARCTHTKADGARCKMTSGLSEAGLCLWHDPDRRTEAQEARSRGGRSSGGSNRLPDRPVPASEAPGPPETFEDAALLAAWAIHAVITGAIDPKRAARVSSLTSVFLKATEKADQEAEIADLRRKMEELGR